MKNLIKFIVIFTFILMYRVERSYAIEFSKIADGCRASIDLQQYLSPESFTTQLFLLDLNSKNLQNLEDALDKATETHFSSFEKAFRQLELNDPDIDLSIYHEFNEKLAEVSWNDTTDFRYAFNFAEVADHHSLELYCSSETCPVGAKCLSRSISVKDIQTIAKKQSAITEKYLKILTKSDNTLNIKPLLRANKRAQQALILAAAQGPKKIYFSAEKISR